MALDQKVADFLSNSSNFRGIDFQFFKQSVSPNSFLEVGKAIRKGRIKVTISNSPELAWYDFQENTLVIPQRHPSGDHIAFGSLIVHEAVHAYHDLQSKEVLEAADEGAAYIAQGLFLDKNQRGGLFDLPSAVWGMVSYYKVNKGFGNLAKEGRETTKVFLRFLKSVRDPKTNRVLYDLRRVTTYNGA